MGFCGLCGGPPNTKEAPKASSSPEVRSVPAAEPPQTTHVHRESIRASLSFKRQTSFASKRLMLLVDATIRDVDLNKAIRRLRMKREQELLVHELKKEGDAERTVRAAFDAAAMNPESKTIHVFVAVGNDGTVNAVANALVACGAPEETCMAVVPRGPGPHEFAAYVDVPLNVADALDVAANSDCYPIDLGLINKKQVFLNMALAGMAAACAVNKDAQLEDCSTPAAYIITPANGKKEGVVNGDCSVEKSGHAETSGNLAFLAVGNGSHLSGARLDDGLLEVMYAMDLPLDKVAALANALSSGSSPATLRGHLHSMQVPWLEVHCPDGLQVNSDGLTLDKEDMRFEVLPHRLRLATSKSITSKLPPAPGTPVKTSTAARHTRTWSENSRSTGPAALQDL